MADSPTLRAVQAAMEGRPFKAPTIKATNGAYREVQAYLKRHVSDPVQFQLVPATCANPVHKGAPNTMQCIERFVGGAYVIDGACVGDRPGVDADGEPIPVPAERQGCGDEAYEIHRAGWTDAKARAEVRG